MQILTVRVPRYECNSHQVMICFVNSGCLGGNSSLSLGWTADNYFTPEKLGAPFQSNSPQASQPMYPQPSYENPGIYPRRPMPSGQGMVSRDKPRIPTPILPNEHSYGMRRAPSEDRKSDTIQQFHTKISQPPGGLSSLTIGGGLPPIPHAARPPLPLSNKLNREAFREIGSTGEKPRASSLQHAFYQITSSGQDPAPSYVADQNYQAAYVGVSKQFRPQVKVAQPPGNFESNRIVEV